MTKNKSLLWVAAFAALSATSIQAQDGAYVHAGLSISAIRSPATNVNFSKINMLGGVGIMVPTDNAQFFFGFEANIAQKGNNVVGASQAGIELTRANLFYSQVPVYAAYSFNERISVFAGPAIGFLLFNAEENLFSVNNQPTDFRTVEISGLAGLMYNFGDHFGGMLRVEHSLLNIYAVDPGFRNIPGARRYNALAAFTIFYRIG